MTLADAYVEHRPAMVRTAERTLERLGVNTMWAEDVVQNAWLRDPLRGFDAARKPLVAWLRVAAKRSALDLARWIRGRAYSRVIMDIDAIAPTVGARTAVQDARLELRQLFSGRCRLYLSQQDRDVIAGFLRDESPVETATRLGRSEAYIHFARDRAVRRVRFARGIRTPEETGRFRRSAA